MATPTAIRRCTRAWTRPPGASAFADAYRDLGRRALRRLRTVLDPYAAESPAEFFAVASEMFFDDPPGLQRGYPAVYAQLALFYRQDPAAHWRGAGRAAMSLPEQVLLLVLVTDPFGNLPLVLAALGRLDAAAYRRAVLRESLFAFAVLLVLGWGGAGLLRTFGITEPALHIGGGVILFLLSLRMIYGGPQGAFQDGYAADPLLVPIAVPAIAGPAAIATVILLRTQQQVPLGQLALGLLGALAGHPGHVSAGATHRPVAGAARPQRPGKIDRPAAESDRGEHDAGRRAALSGLRRCAPQTTVDAVCGRFHAVSPYHTGTHDSRLPHGKRRHARRPQGCLQHLQPARPVPATRHERCRCGRAGAHRVPHPPTQSGQDTVSGRRAVPGHLRAAQWRGQDLHPGRRRQRADHRLSPARRGDWPGRHGRAPPSGDRPGAGAGRRVRGAVRPAGTRGGPRAGPATSADAPDEPRNRRQGTAVADPGRPLAGAAPGLAAAGFVAALRASRLLAEPSSTCPCRARTSRPTCAWRPRR